MQQIRFQTEKTILKTIKFKITYARSQHTQKFLLSVLNEIVYVVPYKATAIAKFQDASKSESSPINFK